jgi:hypothetical protein
MYQVDRPNLKKAKNILQYTAYILLSLETWMFFILVNETNLQLVVGCKVTH